MERKKERCAGSAETALLPVTEPSSNARRQKDTRYRLLRFSSTRVIPMPRMVGERGGIGMGSGAARAHPVDFAAPVLMCGSRACIALRGNLLCNAR
jgi:hypothetical protein